MGIDPDQDNAAADGDDANARSRRRGAGRAAAAAQAEHGCGAQSSACNGARDRKGVPSADQKRGRERENAAGETKRTAAASLLELLRARLAPFALGNGLRLESSAAESGAGAG